MSSHPKLLGLNIVFITTFVAILLGCGGDPETPPSGSTEEKLCGKWVSDPIPFIEGNGATTIEVGLSYWNVGLVAVVPDELTLRNRAGADSHKNGWSACGFKIDGVTVTSNPEMSGDSSTWIFRVDPAQPEVMYASWILKNGIKRLDEVKFRKRKETA